jgi:hypothetical protein
MQENKKNSIYARDLLFKISQDIKTNPPLGTTLLYDNYEILDSLNIEETKYITFGMEFKNCDFKREVRFAHINHNNDFRHHLTFKNCDFQEPISFFRVKLNTVDFINCSSKSQVWIEDNEISLLRISFSNCSDIKFHGSGKYNTCIIGFWGNRTNVDNIFLGFDGIEGSLTITKTYAKRIDIYGTLNNANLNLIDSFINSLLFTSFRNNKKVQISNIQPIESRGSFLTINQSNLGETEFYNINFSLFEEFNIVNSYIANSSFININWHLNINALPGLYTPNFDNRNTLSKRSLEEKRKENFRQLKSASTKAGDTLSEGKFHAYEMNSYYQLLSWKKTKDFGTKIILLFSNRFSNYGQSLSLPLFWLLAGHLILFTTAMALGGFCPLHISFNHPTSKGFEIAFEKFFVYINPLRKTESSLPNYLIIIDITMRIWSSYMIYNIIRATRRFIK